MCFAFDARPPLLPEGVPRLAGGAAAEVLELTSSDGTRFSAAFAETPASRGSAVVIYPDVRGLSPFYIKLAERFAEAGHHAIVLDPFGRTAGLGPRDEHFEWLEHVRASRSAQIQADTLAAIEAVRSRVGDVEFVTVGFCFGGGESLLATTNAGLGLKGAVGFYAGLDRSKMPELESPLGRASEMRGPILGLFGGDDTSIPEEQVRELEGKLDAAGVKHHIHVYPGAPHSFFDRRQDEFADASRDAWHRVLAFVG